VRRRRRRRRGTRGATVGAATLASAAALWLGAPRLLERCPLFRVRQVELVGVKTLAPDALIAALRLPPHASVFADTHLLADRVQGLPGVAEASVVRRWPSTLEVRVREVEPAAFVPAGRGGSLVAVDAHGRALPLDAERAGLDLPVAPADSGVVRVLGVVQTVDPALFQAVISARGVRGGGVALDLGARRVLLGRDAGPAVVQAVALVAHDLAVRQRHYAELDARFAGQVVVRRRATSGRGGV
jgi:cell division septal protein FtsQ